MFWQNVQIPCVFPDRDFFFFFFTIFPVFSVPCRVMKRHAFVCINLMFVSFSVVWGSTKRGNPDTPEPPPPSQKKKNTLADPHLLMVHIHVVYRFFKSCFVLTISNVAHRGAVVSDLGAYTGVPQSNDEVLRSLQV